jgi:hypothetical protein
MRSGATWRRRKSCQLSAVSRQPSAFNRQPSPSRRPEGRPLFILGREVPPAAEVEGGHLHSAISCQLSAIPLQTPLALRLSSGRSPPRCTETGAPRGPEPAHLPWRAVPGGRRPGRGQAPAALHSRPRSPACGRSRRRPSAFSYQPSAVSHTCTCAGAQRRPSRPGGPPGLPGRTPGRCAARTGCKCQPSPSPLSR